MTPASPPLLLAQKLQLKIGSKYLCKNININVTSGQCWGLIGRNGSGKTTLLHTLAGIRPYTNGQIWLEGQKLEHWPRRQLACKLGLLLQQRSASLPATVKNIVLYGRYPHIGPWHSPQPEDLLIVANAIETVGLTSLQQRLITTLSGGEKQRVYLAAILAQAPKIFLLDEPVTHLDLAEQYRFLFILKKLISKGHTVIMSLHDLNHATLFCDQLLILHKGRSLTGSVERLGTTRILSRVLGISLKNLESSKNNIFIPHQVM